jgi:hypothetical protein
VQVFDGNTSDPRTVPAQGETLRRRVGITEVVFVGDRGMVKRTGKTALAAAGSTYITALTQPQIRKLLRQANRYIQITILADCSIQTDVIVD